MERSTRQLISIILWVVAGFLLTNLIISQAGWNEAVLPFALIFLGVVIWLWDWLALGVGGSTPPVGDDDSRPSLPASSSHAALPAAESHTSALTESGVAENFAEEDFHYRLTGTDIGEMTDEFPAVVLPPEEPSASADASITTPAAEAGDGGTADSAAPAESAQPESAAPAAKVEAAAPAPSSPSSKNKGDDLTVIEGIGPKMNAALIAAGIATFEQLAKTDLDHIHKAIEAAGMRFAPSAPTWAEQAGYAAKGDWDGLNAFQDTLTSGRRK